ncbi:unnamed protein product [Mytilus coruscus]|uniref:Ig-like domain-containing protein n=1 Tax=Mytilus coruscus TaxID=42192 RepID=A0A6J8AFH8_MYTCO|nr:unnamed protein product [Mytilus coruscus]
MADSSRSKPDAEIIKCGICLSAFTNPLLLGCFHIVCTPCITKLAEVSLQNLAKFVKPGETIVLECITDKNATMIWSYLKTIKSAEITLTEDTFVNPIYIAKVNLTGNRYLGEYFLKIINVSSQDEGKYGCYQRGHEFSIVQVNLHIEVAPNKLIILTQHKDGIINETEGQVLNITCLAIGGNTKGNISWINVSDVLSHFTELTEWPFVYLKFTTDYKQHGKNLKCGVTHALLSGQLEVSVTFNVLYKPKIYISRYPTGNIDEGQQMKLACLEKSNPPKTNITWIKDGIIVSSNPIYEKTNVNTNDSGNYSCIVFNSLGKEVEDIVIFVNKSNDKYNDDFLDLKSFLCFGILTLSFLLLVVSAICNICIHLHCKKLSRVSSQTVNNDGSGVNIEMTDINNGYHTINEEDSRQEDNEVENQAEIQRTNYSSSDDSDDQSAESDADETGLRELNDYVNPYCTMIHNTVEVHIYKTLDVENNDSNNTVVNLNRALQRSLRPATNIHEVWNPGERRGFESAELQQRLMEGSKYDTGMGPHQVSRFFTNLNYPGICQTSLKKREREVFEPIKQVAKRSVDDSLEEEKKASERFRELLDLDLRSTDCIICSYWEGKGKEQALHNFTRNLCGTSKTMEIVVWDENVLMYMTTVLATVIMNVENHECKNYVLSASDQSLIDMMKHYLHTSRKDKCPPPSETSNSGFYIMASCGNNYKSKGGGVNYLCLPNDPENGQHQSYSKNEEVYGSEYRLGSSVKPSRWSESMNNKEVPCSVCYKKHRSTVLMIPGRMTCYKGWNSEYNGYLMSDHSTHYRRDYACVDIKAEPLDNKNGDEHGAYFYPLRTKCGSLRCPPYTNEADVLCVVCSK